jgi:hypothetical protein
VTRVSIRPARPADLPLIEPWYAEAARAVIGEPIDVPDGELRSRFDAGGLMVVERAGDDWVPVPDWHGPVGLIQHHDAGHATEIAFLAMAAGQRGWGFGSEAVRLLEAQQNVGRYIVHIAPRNGLAVYFWRLLGYRPAHASEAVQRTDAGDMIAMVRDT